MSDVEFRVAQPREYGRVQAAYTAWGYRGGVASGDVVYIAERGGDLIGAVRRTREHGVTLLRGMYVAPREQRGGVGAHLLRVFVGDLDGVECYCVPHVHLEAFYGLAGFKRVASEQAPVFLRERVDSYRARGLDVLVMCRPARPLHPDHAA